VIDYFALALVHALLALAFLRMVRRDALDREDEGARSSDTGETDGTAGEGRAR